MSEPTARNLVSRGAEIAVVANRTLEHGQELAQKLKRRARSRSTRSRPSSSTPTSSSPRRARPTSCSRREVVAAALGAQAAARSSSSTWPFRATSIPRSTSSTSCFLYDVDDLEAVVAETLSGRRGEAARAERLVAAEAERFREWQASLDVVPTIASLRALVEEIRDSELAPSALEALGARAPAGRIGHLADPREAAPPPDDPDEGGGRGSRWSGLR